MTKAEIVCNEARQRIGCPYVMGGTGKVCSPSYREARAAQYPLYAQKIRDNCPRMKGTASTCTACKWADPETGKGKLCYDCAQLVRACFAAVDIPLVSGANSQWRRTRWAEKGNIDQMPHDKVCIVFRDDGDHMGHVGVYMGDETVTHARGHAFGVVNDPLNAVKLTHYGIPSGLYDDQFPTVRRGNRGEYVTILQTALTSAGIKCATDGIFGADTEEAVKAFQKKNGLTADGICGPKTWDALNLYIRNPPEEPEQPEEPETPEPDAGSIAISSDDLNELISIANRLNDLLARIGGYVG